MHTPELIKHIAEGTGLSQKVVQEVLKEFTSTVTETLKNGEEVRMQGFLAIKPKNTPARTCRNPQTGALVSVEAKRSVTISPGKSLKAALNA